MLREGERVWLCCELETDAEACGLIFHHIPLCFQVLKGRRMIESEGEISSCFIARQSTEITAVSKSSIIMKMVRFVSYVTLGMLN